MDRLDVQINAALGEGREVLIVPLRFREQGQVTVPAVVRLRERDDALVREVSQVPYPGETLGDVVRRCRDTLNRGRAG